jgi:hypothetical protein
MEPRDPVLKGTAEKVFNFYFNKRQGSESAKQTYNYKRTFIDDDLENLNTFLFIVTLQQ